MPSRRIHCIFLLAFALLAAAFVHADDWPGWRGPEGSGHSKETNLPTKWTAKSVVWKAALPGEGQSSPVVAGERIFLTSALEKGKKRLVLCVDRNTGKILWQQVAWSGTPEKSHKMNGWATPTCATDGERVIAFFGKGGLHCYSVEGKKLWSRDLGAFTGDWGVSACPLIVGDLVIQNCDATTNAYLLAVNKTTGKDVWKTPRLNTPKGGWSSPILVEAEQRKEIVLNGEEFVIGYDPATGKELWKCKAFIGRGEPTVAPGNGLVVVINGLAGDIYAVKTGGAGDVTMSHMAWHTRRKGGRDQPSPIIVGNYVLTVDMADMATCYDAAKGTELWKEHLRGVFTSSPIAAGGLVYFQNEGGETFVIEPGPTLKVVAKNTVGAGPNEIFRAALTPAHGQFFTRSQAHLYCIGK